MDSCDVLVIGAGPTGLLMAAELARYGVNCRIIDRSPAPSEHSKALAIQAKTMEIFHFLGIDSEFLEKGKKLKALNIYSKLDRIGHVEFQSLPSPFPYILSLEQSATEQILIDHLQSYGLKVEREVELIGIEEEGEGVIATIQASSDQQTQVRAKWVIGCDGAHSFVRKHLNLTFKGKAFPVVFSLADVQIDWKYPDDEVSTFWSPEGILAAIPLPHKGHFRLIFELQRCQNKSQKISEDNLQVDLPPPKMEEVKEIVWQFADSKADVSHPYWLANFHVNSRLSNSYQIGRFFLAGDAAHIHSPIGGQGMNTGLQDACNLAWKLAFSLQGKISTEILNSYQSERHAVATSLLKRTEIGTRAVSLDKRWKIFLRDHAVSFLLRFPFAKKRLLMSISQIGLEYPASRDVREEGSFKRGPKAGSRLPDFSLGQEKKLYDLLIKLDSFLLICFLGVRSDSKEIEKSLKKLSVPIQILLISQTVLAQNDVQVFHDADGEMHREFGAEKGALYVVRPDTYIGYRQTPIDPQRLIAYFNQYSNEKEKK